MPSISGLCSNDCSMNQSSESNKTFSTRVYRVRVVPKLFQLYRLVRGCFHDRHERRRASLLSDTLTFFFTIAVCVACRESLPPMSCVLACRANEYVVSRIHGSAVCPPSLSTSASILTFIHDGHPSDRWQRNDQRKTTVRQQSGNSQT
jgi:hypothetical protein